MKIRILLPTIAFILAIPHALNAISLPTINKNDPYPFMNSLYPYDFLHKSDDFAQEEFMEKQSPYRACCARGRFTFSGFYQRASKGTSIRCEFDGVPYTGIQPEYLDNASNLGDLLGTWNMFGLFYPYADENKSLEINTGNALTPSPLETSPMQLGLGQLVIQTPGQGLVINEGGTPATYKFSDVNKESFYRFITNPQNEDPNCTPVNIPSTENATQTCCNVGHVVPKLGHLSIPIEYRKYGVRSELFLDMFCNLALIVQGGACCIRQKPCIHYLTCDRSDTTIPLCPLYPNPDFNPTEGSANITLPNLIKLTNEYLTNDLSLGKIAKALGYNLACYQKTAFEDTTCMLLLRGTLERNADRKNPSLPHLVFSPFIAAQLSIPTGDTPDPRCLFALPTGNMGCWGVGGVAGLSIDFLDSVEFGFDAGAMSYQPRTINNMPVPTQQFQQGLYPYTADVKYTPGTSFTWGLSVNAFHIIETLSLYASYRSVCHQKDCYEPLRMHAPQITITPFDVTTITAQEVTTTYGLPVSIPTPPTSAVLTGKMCNQSCWRMQMLFMGLSYDITRTVSLGLSAQIPLVRCNAYRTATVLGTIGVLF